MVQPLKLSYDQSENIRLRSSSRFLTFQIFGSVVPAMVRVLVATTIREAAAGADDDALLKLMDATCRRTTAPPNGLCLIDVGYTDYDRSHWLIP
ncbi:hypothetical protein RND71_012978 [Anisodus tanguticus]|uniref:tRNA pseudouridine synthase n=1 Tax=Anisodus tanguticus TaxID=243964 RepID=A0AAE1SI44_9SOLA|nr:hypothetical protein RND71_012978 [Anisodus tanguticus]